MSWRDWLGGGVDFVTGGLTDFDQKGSGGYNWMPGTFGQQFNPIGGGHDQKWGPSVGTQAGNFLGEYVQDNPGIFGPGGSGGSGTQQVGSSTPGKSFSFSNATAPSGSSFVSSDYGSGGGGNRIGSWYMDEGSGPMLAEAMIRQKYTPLQRTWHNESYGPGGGSGGGSSTGDAIKGFAGKAIDLVGGKILDSFM